MTTTIQNETQSDLSMIDDVLDETRLTMRGTGCCIGEAFDWSTSILRFPDAIGSRAMAYLVGAKCQAGSDDAAVILDVAIANVRADIAIDRGDLDPATL